MTRPMPPGNSWTTSAELLESYTHDTANMSSTPHAHPLQSRGGIEGYEFRGLPATSMKDRRKYSWGEPTEPEGRYKTDESPTENRRYVYSGGIWPFKRDLGVPEQAPGCHPRQPTNASTLSGRRFTQLPPLNPRSQYIQSLAAQHMQATAPPVQETHRREHLTQNMQSPLPARQLSPQLHAKQAQLLQQQEARLRATEAAFPLSPPVSHNQQADNNQMRAKHQEEQLAYQRRYQMQRWQQRDTVEMFPIPTRWEDRTFQRDEFNNARLNTVQQSPMGVSSDMMNGPIVYPSSFQYPAGFQLADRTRPQVSKIAENMLDHPTNSHSTAIPNLFPGSSVRSPPLSPPWFHSKPTHNAQKNALPLRLKDPLDAAIGIVGGETVQRVLRDVEEGGEKLVNEANYHQRSIPAPPKRKTSRWNTQSSSQFPSNTPAPSMEDNGAIVENSNNALRAARAQKRPAVEHKDKRQLRPTDGASEWSRPVSTSANSNPAKVGRPATVEFDDEAFTFLKNISDMRPPKLELSRSAEEKQKKWEQWGEKQVCARQQRDLDIIEQKQIKYMEQKKAAAAEHSREHSSGSRQQQLAKMEQASEAILQKKIEAEQESKHSLGLRKQQLAKMKQGTEATLQMKIEAEQREARRLSTAQSQPTPEAESLEDVKLDDEEMADDEAMADFENEIQEEDWVVV